jgi:hypothetical protein
MLHVQKNKEKKGIERISFYNIVILGGLCGYSVYEKYATNHEPSESI